MPVPGDSLSAQDVEALEHPALVEDAVDIDLDAWLTEQAEAGRRRSHVEIDGKRIPIAVVTEGEENRLLKESRRPNPTNPREMQVDSLAYRRAYVAFALSKASGRQIAASDQRILDMPPGIVTQLMKAIQELSRYPVPERSRSDPFGFSS